MKVENELEAMSNNVSLLQEAFCNKSKSVAKQNISFQSDLLLLKQEYQKRENHNKLFYRTEIRKLLLKHNMKMRAINLQ